VGKRTSYRFTVHQHRSRLIIGVSEQGITIKKVCAGGAGTLGDHDDAYKTEVIGRVASLQQIWNLRVRGYTEIAEGALKVYRQKRIEQR